MRKSAFLKDNSALQKRKPALMLCMFLGFTLCVLYAAGLMSCKSGEGDEGSYVVRTREGDDGKRNLRVDGRDIVVSGISGSLPEDWPSDIIPLHIAAAVGSAQTVSSAESGPVAYQLELEVPESFVEVAEWYGGALIAAGWAMDQQISSGDEGFRRMLYAASRVNGSISVLISESDAITYVSIEAAVVQK